MVQPTALVIGAGIGGLVAALRLAAEGVAVTVLDRQAEAGGKLREIDAGEGARIDAGPTVFTMPWIFEEILGEVGETLSDHVSLAPAAILARHAWPDGSRLDLFADREASAQAIASLAGHREADGYRTFIADARRTFETLDRSFMRAERPSIQGLVAGVGLMGLPALWSIKPFTNLWSALGTYFRDPRLRQLFARYATYCGSSPFFAPATLMLVAHVEQEGVYLVRGGMARLGQALARLAEARGAVCRFGADAERIDVVSGQAVGVTLATGERLTADVVILNGDAAALAGGQFGADAGRAVPRTAPSQRSLSAVTFALTATTENFPLHRHNVFFSTDYRAEFDDIGMRRMLPREPTTYVCAQDRGEGHDPQGHERLFLLVNAPATGDSHTFTTTEIARCRDSTMGLLARCGLTIRDEVQEQRITTPNDWESLFPGTGGALYGTASHGWAASFSRPPVRTRLKGLYLAGGSVHPGPGLPMAALSGRQAALSALADLASTRRSRRTAMFGGTSTA